MTDEHTAALKRARDSVRNAQQILASVEKCCREVPVVLFDLNAAETLLSLTIELAIDEESKG